MSATNHTSNYNLPLFIGSDVPSWLVDWNNSMTDIDTALSNINSVATSAGSKADEVENNIGAVNTALTNLTNIVSNLSASVYGANPYNINVNNSYDLSATEQALYTPPSDGFILAVFRCTHIDSQVYYRFMPCYNVNGSHYVAIGHQVEVTIPTGYQDYNVFFRVFKNKPINLNYNMSDGVNIRVAKFLPLI